jgi:hypothetical protein
MDNKNNAFYQVFHASVARHFETSTHETGKKEERRNFAGKRKVHAFHEAPSGFYGFCETTPTQSVYEASAFYSSLSSSSSN